MHGNCMQNYRWETYGGRYHLGDPGIDRSTILKWILNKMGMIMWTGFIWLRTEATDRLL
jgi:hypothetical protein